MKIFIVVKYADVEVFGLCGDSEYVTETEILEAYSNKQDANIECRQLSRQRAFEETSISYDVIETELN